MMTSGADGAAQEELHDVGAVDFGGGQGIVVADVRTDEDVGHV
jgi:hypothetical protein